MKAITSLVKIKKVRVSRSPSIRDGVVIPSIEQVPIIRDLQGGQNKVLLAFSGKDSLAAWLFLRDQGFEVIPYWLYLVPNLSFDEQMLAYYEKHFKTHIMRFPHPYFYTLIGDYVWQTPERWGVIYSLRMQDANFSFSDIQDDIIEEKKLHPNTYTVHSFRAADSLARRIMIKHQGSIGLTHRYWYVIWDWKIQEVMERIAKDGLKLSSIYAVTGATGEVWGYHWLKAIKKEYPQDYKKILDVFPLAELEFFRYEKVRPHNG